MLGEEAVEIMGDVRGERGRAAGAHVHVGREEFDGGGQNVIVSLGHEVDEVKLFFGAGDEASAEGDALADTYFYAVAYELGEGKAAKVFRPAASWANSGAGVHQGPCCFSNWQTR